VGSKAGNTALILLSVWKGLLIRLPESQDKLWQGCISAESDPVRREPRIRRPWRKILNYKIISAFLSRHVRGGRRLTHKERSVVLVTLQ
jgi:hypothetical protein